MLMRSGLALIFTLACAAVQAASIEMLKSLLQQTNSGKARFAQVAARHVDQAGALPAYVTEAIAWLRAG